MYSGEEKINHMVVGLVKNNIEWLQISGFTWEELEKLKD